VVFDITHQCTGKEHSPVAKIGAKEESRFGGKQGEQLRISYAGGGVYQAGGGEWELRKTCRKGGNGVRIRLTGGRKQRAGEDLT